MHTFIMAIRALSAYKLRTFFAIIGVLFGALILTLLLNISEAMVLKTRLEIDKLGPNLMTAMAGTLRFDKGTSTADTSGVTSFSLKDYQDIMDSVQGIASGAPFITSFVQARLHSTTIRATLIATTPEYKVVRTLPIAYGDFFTTIENGEKAKVVVLGYAIAKHFFEIPADAVGKTFRIDKTIVTVIGVAEELGQSPTGARPDEYIYIPITTYMRRMANQTYITGVYLSLFPHTNRVEIKENVGNILRKNHGIYGAKADDFVLFTADETVKLQNKTLRLVRSLGFLVACISFAIGGLGILSIMILLVRIRRVEIGIRRAIGATRRDIIVQFLYESVLMAGIGGIVGMALGCLFLYPVYALGGFPIVYSIPVIAGATVSSLGIGILAGVYPAWEASRVDILQALKSHT